MRNFSALVAVRSVRKIYKTFLNKSINFFLYAKAEVMPTSLPCLRAVRAVRAVRAARAKGVGRANPRLLR